MADLSRVRRIGDRLILEELQKRGDTLSAPHHVIVFFCRRKDDRRSAELVCSLLAQRLEAHGWSIAELNADGVTAERHRTIDPDSVNDVTDQMESLADETGTEFDGWECEVIAGGSE